MTKQIFSTGNWVRFRRFVAFSVALSIAMALPVPWTSATAGPVVDPSETQDLERQMAEDFAKANDFNAKWGDLETLPAGQPRGSLAADRFLLMEQTAVPNEVPVVSRLSGQILRLNKLIQLIGKIDRYTKKIEAGKVEAKTFEDLDVVPRLSDEEARKAALEYVNEGRLADTPYFVWIRRRDADQLKALRSQLGALYQDWNEARKKKTANYTEAPTVRRARLVNWWDVDVVVKEGDRKVKTLSMADTARYKSLSNRAPFFCADDVCRFDLTTKGETLNTFGIDSKVVATFGQFVIFAHRDSYDSATGVQYLSFLDLETYGTSVGNEDIPVFRLPVKTDAPITSFRAVDDRLILNEKFWIDGKLLQDASDLQQTAFNLTSNLVDPAEWEATLPLIDAFRDHLRDLMEYSVAEVAADYKGIKQADVMFGRLGQELQQQIDANAKLKATEPNSLNKAALEKAKGDTKFAESVKAVELYHKRVMDSDLLKSRMTSITDRVANMRKLKGRIDLLISKMLSPKPWASQKIKEALGIYAVKKNDSMFDFSKRGIIGNLMDHPYLNTGVIAAAAMAVVAPDSFHQMVNAGLGVGASVYDYIGFALRGMGEAVLTGADRSFAALYEPVKALGDQYVHNGNWYRTTVFLSAFIPQVLAIYYIPHFLFNFYRYKQDIKSGRARNLIEQQTLVRREYLRKQAEEDSLKHSGEAVQLTDEDQKGIDLWLADRREGKHKAVNSRFGWFTRLFKKGKASPAEKAELAAAAMEAKDADITAAVTAGEKSSAVNDVARMGEADFKTFWQAARHMVFTGMPSYEYSLLRWASFWNWYAGWRFCSVGFKGVRICKTNIPLMVSPKPVMWASRVLYPDLFSTVVARRDGHLTLPTELNGGLRKREAYDFVDVVNKGWAERLRERFQGTTRQQLQALERFEDQIIEVEKQVIEVAFRESLAALARFVTDRKDLEVVFGADPLKSITGPQIKDLSYAAQTFVRAHFESIYDEAMHKFMEQMVVGQAQEVRGLEEVSEAIKEQIKDQATIAQDPEALVSEVPLKSLKTLKMEAVHTAALQGRTDFGFDLERAKQIAIAVAAGRHHAEKAAAAASKGRQSLANVKMNTRFNVVSNLDPEQNPSMARWNVVHKRLKSPGALGRAVRAEIAKLLVTLPLNISMKLFLAAGIMAGAMKPIQEEFWGPNSTFYGSHTSFYMLFMSGFAMSMMADAWLKVQMDQRQDDMGEFGQIPKGEDAVNGMVRWWKKQFMASENSLWKNYLFNNKVIFWNLPAALFNISLFYWAFSGRLDLSLIIAGYAVSFGTPLYALHTKIDQAFERSVHFAARGLKSARWLADPRVQEVLLKEQQRARNVFNLANDIYSTVEGEVVTTIEMIPTSLGPRGFARALFGGTLLEEKIVNNILDPLAASAQGIPGVEHTVNAITRACEELLTRGNPDLVNLHKPGK